MIKYIVINSEDIQKRIEELEPISIHNCKVGEYDSEGQVIDELKQILSNSKPLEEELSKAIESGIQSFESNAYEVPKRIEEFKQSVNDESLKARQVFEDMRYYNQVHAEAMRQVNRPKGWLIDPSRGNLMQIYTIYNEATAKYKGVSSLALCLQIIEEHSKQSIKE